MRAIVVSSQLHLRSAIRNSIGRSFPDSIVDFASSVELARTKLSQSPFDIAILHDEQMNNARSFIDSFNKTPLHFIIVHSVSNGESFKSISSSKLTEKFTLIQKPFPESLQARNSDNLSEEETLFLNDLIKSCQKIFPPIIPNGGQNKKINEPVPNLTQSIRTQKCETYKKSTKDLNSLFSERSGKDFSCLVIGSSTGGPDALHLFFKQLTTPLHLPIFIVQHIPAGFTAKLAETLSAVGAIKFSEAKHGDAVVNGHGLLAPGDWHMRLKRDAGGLSIQLLQTEYINSVRPAVDPLFQDASELFSRPPLGIIFTGMGEDGQLGCQAVVKAKGLVLTQSEASCVVYGMPRAVDEACLSSGSGTPAELGQFIQLLFAKP